MKNKFIRTNAAIGAAVLCAECVPMPSAMQEVSAKQVTLILPGPAASSDPLGS